MIQRAEFRVYRQADGSYVALADVERVGEEKSPYVRYVGATPGEALAEAVRKTRFLDP